MNEITIRWRSPLKGWRVCQGKDCGNVSSWEFCVQGEDVIATGYSCALHFAEVAKKAAAQIKGKESKKTAVEYDILKEMEKLRAALQDNDEENFSRRTVIVALEQGEREIRDLRYQVEQEKE